MHEYIAELFASKSGCQIVGQPNIKHHYGMPTPTSIVIGTFAIDTRSTNNNDLVVPVFSDLGKDICIFSVSRIQHQTYTPSGTNQRIVLVPHGWGQVINGIKSLHVDNANDEMKRKLILEASETHEIDVIYKNRLTIEEKHVRQFDSISSFLNNNCTNIKGKIKTILHPVYCYCSRTVKSENNSIAE